MIQEAIFPVVGQSGSRAPAQHVVSWVKQLTGEPPEADGEPSQYYPRSPIFLVQNVVTDIIWPELQTSEGKYELDVLPDSEKVLAETLTLYIEKLTLDLLEND